MFKTKGAMFGIAAALAVAGLTFASMAVSTASGAGTDEVETPVAQPTTAPPPQSPIEAPADTTADPTGGQQSAGTSPDGLPDAGYGTEENSSTNTTLLGLAGIVLMAGSGVMFAASKASGRKA